MVSKAFPQLNSDDRIINQLQSNVANAITPLLQSPISSPVLLKSIKLSVGSTLVDTGLSQEITGWMITRMRGAFAEIYDTIEQDGGKIASNQLPLTSNKAITVDIMVF